MIKLPISRIKYEKFASNCFDNDICSGCIWFNLLS